MAMPEWLVLILRILKQAGVRVQFMRLYRDGQNEVGIILGGVRWEDIFTQEVRR